ncbi:ABC transporter permease [Glaciihabitans sp. dw_435]|uniref:ABC transporter permease n=1 Tax=Glaciihabitans sp. dw_435 TaxID=2720081 RepID=UPI001BD635AC|nr:ABC transporter permease [Glaciihabitans sp. dw_435]
MTAATLVPERMRLARGLGGRLSSEMLSWFCIGLFALVCLIVVFAPLIAPYDPIQPIGAPYTPPFTSKYILGTDSIGRDVLSRLIYGVQSTWPLGILVVVIGIAIGGAVGAIAGVVGGWLDNLLMRVTDLFLALPAALVAIAIVAFLGPGTTNMLIGISIVWWPYFARIVRGEVHSLAARPHVEAARMTGVGRRRIATRHILPGVVPTLVVLASIDIGSAILTISSLSFLGLGTPPPAAELGADAAHNAGFLLQAWWVPVIPGLGVLVLTIVANLAGSGVRNLMLRR